MEKTLIKIGNLTGFTIPPKWLTEIHLCQSSKVTLVREHDRFFVQPSTQKPKFDITDILVKTNFKSQR